MIVCCLSGVIKDNNNRIVLNIWNSLPNAVVDVDYVDSFKSKLDNFWISQDVKYYRPTL